MLTSVQVAMLVLTALFVGIVIPVLFSFRSLMKRTEKTLNSFDLEMRTVLGRAGEVLDRVDTIGEGIQDGIPKLNKSLERIENFSQSLEGLRKNVKTASMMGAAAAPVIASVIQAIRAASAKTQEAESCEGEDRDRAADHREEWSAENLKPEDFVPQHIRQKENEDE